MSRISSKTTFFYKRVFPFVWFGGLLIFSIVDLLLPSRGSETSKIPDLILPVLMGGFGYWFMRTKMFSLVDEVLDAGDALIVRNDGQEERISLSDIDNVKYSPYVTPPQVTLSLRRHTVFGDTVVFCGPFSPVPMFSSPVIDDLISRIEWARRKR